MEHSLKYRFMMSQLTHIEDVKETEKTKISIVYHTGNKTSCILRICKNRDLSAVCEALLKIRSANTVVVYDFVYENGNTYILEENIDGNTVAETIELNGCFSESATAKVIIEVCKALENLHRLQPPIVHNDINPSNIRIREDGSVKLFDFDISRFYRKGQHQNTELFGTEEYASPEHFGYGQSEPRTDIYCLGVTMHKMLTNQGLSHNHRITYTGKLKAIINKCLAFDPKDRYSSVSELRKELERFLKKGKGLALKILGVGCVAILIASALFLSQKLGKSDGGYEPDVTNSFMDQTESGGGVNMPTMPSSNLTTNAKSDIPENSAAETTEPTDSQETPISVQPNDSRKAAKAITLNQQISDFVESNTDDWYKFLTTANISAYRISVYPQGDENKNMLFPYICVGIYDSLGIKLEEVDVWSDDDCDFIDLYLDPNTEYYLKVSLGSSRFNSGSYKICVFDMVCDAGIDMNSATEIMLGTMHTATLNSTLSDWYVFRVPEAGDYTYTIHNIDVGCDIYFSLKKPTCAGEGTSIPNEDNYSGEIRNAVEGDSIFLEIHTYKDDPAANGQYIIIIEKLDS